VYLVDTSVLIDVLNNRHNEKTALFGRLEDYKVPYGITPYTCFKLIQGIKSEAAVEKMIVYLSSIPRYWLPQVDESYQAAAEIYRRCRRSGVTPRSSIDILIAQTAIHYDLELLHNDKDFDNIQTVITELRVAR
jgi:predicted nucleic acid-binding protein